MDLSVGDDPEDEEEVGGGLGLAAVMGATVGLGRGVFDFGVGGDGDVCCCHPIVFGLASPAAAVAVAGAPACFFLGLGPPVAGAEADGRFWVVSPALLVGAAGVAAPFCFAGSGVWFPFGPLF